MTDLTYTQQGLFTRFIATSKSGEDAWKVIAEKMNGDAVIFSMHLKSVLRQLRKAGYKVSKAKPVTKKEMNKIFDEMDALGL